MIFDDSQETSTIAIKLQELSLLLNDPSLTEIIINQPGEVLTEGRGCWTTHTIPAIDHEWCMDLAHLLQNRSSQSIDESSPLLGATLPDGQRVQVAIPPAVPHVSITIRRPGDVVLSLGDIIASGAFKKVSLQQSTRLSESERSALEHLLPEKTQCLLHHFRRQEWDKFFKTAVEQKETIIASGITGSGKTTLANALCQFIPLHERIITVEDVREMRLPHKLVSFVYSKGGKGVSKLTVKDILEACLRMRPDRILLSELRGDETYFFIQNVINSGHPGPISTMHANSSKLAFQRLSLMIKASPEGATIDRADIMEMLYSLINIVVQMHRLDDGRRVVTEVYFDPAFAIKQLG